MGNVLIDPAAFCEGLIINADEMVEADGFLKVYRNNALVALFDLKTIKSAVLDADVSTEGVHFDARV